MTSEFVSAIDLGNVSSRNSRFVLAAAYQSVEVDIDACNLNHSRGRIRYRKIVANHSKDVYTTEDCSTVQLQNST